MQAAEQTSQHVQVAVACYARGLVAAHRGRSRPPAARPRRAWALATAGRCRGILAGARGDLEGALAALDQALADHERLAMPFELARTLLVQGQVRRRLKHKRSAKESLDGALRIFAELGAPLWAERARSELQRLGLRPPAPGDLTPTERRVAELVAAGCTNREVATALFVSVHTVEDNLKRIYRKLRSSPGRSCPCGWRPGPRSFPEQPGRGTIHGFRGFPTPWLTPTLGPASDPPGGPKEPSMPTYVAERYLPGVTWEQVLDAARRVKRSAAQLAAAGTPVRYLRSTFLPTDETCCCLFQAPSEDAVRQANDRAQIPFDRIVEVVHVAAEDLVDGSDATPRAHAHAHKEQP